MNTLDIFEKLKNAYECSTHKANYFKQALESVKWDHTFFADEEYYFIKGDLTFTTPSLDPFSTEWAPSGMFTDTCRSFNFY